MIVLDYFDRAKELFEEGITNKKEITEKLIEEGYDVSYQAVRKRLTRAGYTEVEGQLKTIKNQKEKKPTISTIREQRTPQTIHSKILNFLDKEKLNLLELSILLGTEEKVVDYALEELEQKGYNIENINGFYTINKSPLPKQRKILLPFYENTYRFGIVSDTHAGSTHEQLTHLNTMYDIFEAKGITEVYHAGDITTGIKMYRGQEFESHKHGADQQKEWTIKNYPKRRGIKTIVAAGNHDGSYISASGYDITRSICTERDDMEYIGYCEGQVELENGLKIELLHPDGGVPYAQSYRSQKINEARGRGKDVPHITIYGHCHISLFNPYLGAFDIMAGCFEGQTTYEKRKGLNPQIGGWIVQANMKDGEINRIQQEWIEFKEIKDDWKNY